MRYALGRRRAADHVGALDTLYRIEDPWNMGSPREQARFVATNRLIEREFGRVGDLLEIACGEGHQSEHLRRVCDRLVGVDVSGRAVERARRRVPDARFELVDLSRSGWRGPPDRFDLVTACEMLYDLQDVAPMIERMNALGRACFVTFYSPAAERLSPHLSALPLLGRESFGHGDVEWLACWWRNPA